MEVFSGNTQQSDSLKQAILIYGAFATVHKIERRGKKKQPVILPGMLATKDGILQALRALLPEEDRGTGLLPETMLAMGVGHMVWWVKPAKRTVWFDCKELGGKKSATVPYPGLVMAVVNNDWFVWAVKGNSRPGPETKLYQAPNFNVWSSGRICCGSARTPEGEHQKVTAAWESAFFESVFSHPNVHAPEKLVSKGSPFKFWLDMLEGKYTKFPEGMLVDRSLTLQSMFSKIIQKG